MMVQDDDDDDDDGDDDDDDDNTASGYHWTVVTVISHEFIKIKQTERQVAIVVMVQVVSGSVD